MPNVASNSSVPLMAESVKAQGWTFCHYLLVILGILWLVGILYVEFFYYYTRRLRTLDPKIKERMEPFTDNPGKWNKIVFYICKESLN